MSFLRDFLEEFSFTRLGDLRAKVVGSAVGDKRPTVRWPEEIASFKKNVKKSNAVKALIGSSLALIGSVFILTISVLGVVAFRIAGLNVDLFCKLGLVIVLLSLVLLITGAVLDCLDTEQCGETSEIMEPLLGKDPYLDLRAAAFLTVGAMPEWLREQMSLERRPEWRRARLAEEPYTVERAGFDYLDLMLRIEQLDKTPSMFYGKSFPSAGYRLPGALKDAVGEIILFLSSLPDSGEDPRMDVEEAVMDTISQLATIDGESFTAALHDAKLEELAKKTEVENKKRDAYNDAVLDAVNAAQALTPDENDEACKTVLRGMEKLHKLSETGKKRKRAVEPALKAGTGSAVTPLSR